MPTCACDAFFIIRGGDSVTVWGARKELRVCGRVPYSQRTPYSYGYAYTNASATTVYSHDGLTDTGTGRERGGGTGALRENPRKSHSRISVLTQHSSHRAQGQGRRPKAQNITGKLYSIALSLSHAPRAIDVPFAGSTAGQRRVQIVTEGARAPNNPSGPPRCVAWNPKAYAARRARPEILTRWLALLKSSRTTSSPLPGVASAAKP